MEVIEPAALSVDVKEGRYAAAVEAAFNAMQLRVCLCWIVSPIKNFPKGKTIDICLSMR